MKHTSKQCLEKPVVKFKIILYFKYYIYIQLVGEYFFSCRTICSGGVSMFTVVRLLWYWRTRPLGIYVVGIIENTRLASIRYWPAYRQVLLSIQDTQVLNTGIDSLPKGWVAGPPVPKIQALPGWGGGLTPCLAFFEDLSTCTEGPQRWSFITKKWYFPTKVFLIPQIDHPTTSI